MIGRRWWRTHALSDDRPQAPALPEGQTDAERCEAIKRARQALEQDEDRQRWIVDILRRRR